MSSPRCPRSSSVSAAKTKRWPQHARTLASCPRLRARPRDNESPTRSSPGAARASEARAHREAERLRRDDEQQCQADGERRERARAEQERQLAERVNEQVAKSQETTMSAWSEIEALAARLQQKTDGAALSRTAALVAVMTQRPDLARKYDEQKSGDPAGNLAAIREAHNRVQVEKSEHRALDNAFSAIGEIVQFRVGDVDPEGEGRLYVAEEDGKTEAATRRLDGLPDDLAAVLRRLAQGREAEEWLFASKGSQTGHRDVSWLRKVARGLATRAGIKYVCPHGLRGTQGSEARRGGATAEMVAAQLGHASTRVTLEHYVQKEADESTRVREAVEALKGKAAMGNFWPVSSSPKSDSVN